MDRSFRHLRMAISSIRLIPHFIIMLGMHNRAIVEADLERWAEIYHLAKPTNVKDFVVLFLTFMTFVPEYRNVFYLRVGLASWAFSWLCPPVDTLQIVPTRIGRGLFIQHGISTLVSADSIGDNCWINQHVVVGFSNDTDRPTIGNNVRISAGAKIIGKVRIGDNATIGPNTVVLDDVEAGVTVLGVPGRVVWRGGPKPS
jgi:serine O-acetyltransferase